jgi:hypothetical protein
MVIVEPPWRAERLCTSRAAAHEAVVVDAVVLVEALVLDRDGRVLEHLRDPAARDHGAVGLARDDPEELLVLVVDARVLAEADLLELFLAEVLRHRVDGQGRHQHHAAEHRREDAAEDEQEVGATPARAPLTPPAPSAQVAHGATGSGSGRMFQATRPVG